MSLFSPMGRASSSSSRAAARLRAEHAHNPVGLTPGVGGGLSPIGGAGPAHLGMVELMSGFDGNGSEKVVLAKNPKLPGGETPPYLADRLRGGVRVPRL